MAVYFDYPIHPSEDDEFTNEVLAWHKTSPLLAIGSSSRNGKGIVKFYLDEAEVVDGSSIEKDNTAPVQMVWHPSKKLLAVGWSNGEICIWNESDKDVHEAPIFHKSTLTNIHWNGTGSRLITADQNGLICVWKIDQRGRLQQSPMFQNEVGSPIVQMAFKIAVSIDAANDLVAAAKAAVNGDKDALDVFDWQKAGQSQLNMSQAESIQMYFGTKDGAIYFMDDRGKCKKCYQLDNGIKHVLYYEVRDIIVVITENLILTQHTLQADGQFSEVSKAKLGGNATHFQASWAGSGLLATCSKERLARIIDIDNDQNYILNLNGNSAFVNGETINCLSYNAKKGVLAGGTNKGHIAIWKNNLFKPDDPWDLQSPCEVEGGVQSIEWGGGGSLMASITDQSATILSESIMNVHFNQHVVAVQTAPNQLTVRTLPSSESTDLKTDIHIKGVYCTKNFIAIWNSRKVAIYEISDNKSLIRSAGTFNSDAATVAMYEQNIYILEGEKISIRTFQGTIKQEMKFSETEGDPSVMSICGPYMAVGTTKSILKIFDLSRREARQISISKNLEDAIPSFGSIQCLRCNCNGSKVAFISQNNFVTSAFLYIWDVETDTVQCFNFATGEGIEQMDDNLTAAQEQLTSNIKGYVPSDIHWDSDEAKLLVCEAIKSSLDKPSSNERNKPGGGFSRKVSNLKTKEPEPTNIIVTMFSTPDHGLIVQDHFNKQKADYSFLGISTPWFYFAKGSLEHTEENEESEQAKNEERIIQTPMRDFAGLEDCDETVKKAMTNFSYLSAIGNMDEAFKAIKTIKRLDFSRLELDVLGFDAYRSGRKNVQRSGSVWENMARMCVKTKRLDVAMVCLGNMGNAIAAKAVRECQREESDVNVQTAMLAIQIGMYKEAEELYKESGRFDLLNEFYQASNQWSKALECADTHDRIHLRTTHYNYGKYLEDEGRIDEAIKQFESSETYRIEVPRMLNEDYTRLENYIRRQNEPKLYKWFAQYLESSSDMDEALQYYTMANDYLARVRIHCFCEEFDRAAELCDETGDKAASYHLARQFDNNDEINKAIHYFSRAQAYSNAIRLAKDNEMDHELMNLALLSSQEDMLDSARYFEMKAMEDKAVILYHKGGRPSKAIDLAFKTEQFGALQLISEDLDENADPEVLRKCAEFFIDHEQYDKAVNLLVVAKKFEEALDMCLDHHITITEEMGEKLTLPKDYEDAKYRLRLLEKLGEVAFKQGSYHLSTKKFTQAGNKIKAMKALLKSGDTEKIIFFAGVSRQKDIYIMAANYLQSLDWRKDPEIMKGIINFYTKGRALDSLASFYDACAQVEMDEFQNYEKAFGALSESYKCLNKVKPKNQTEHEDRVATIKARLTVMKKFIQAKKSYDSSIDESIKACIALLDDPDVEIAIRVGDVYSFVVSHFTAAQDYQQAYNLMENMRQRFPHLKIQQYIKRKIIERIYNELQIALPSSNQNNGGGRNQHRGGARDDSVEESEGEIDEEVDEIEDDDDMI
ncbi:intraflagellar transport protein 140 homolog isoform X1 [Clytia hemisphaerica]